MKSRKFKVYAPLQNFIWNGEDFKITPDVLIRRYQSPPDLSGLEKHISIQEWKNVLRATHWAEFYRVDKEGSSTTETIYLIMLSLWMVKPHRCHSSFQFEIGYEEASSQQTMRRLLDRFTWVPGTVDPVTTDSELELASTHYRKLSSLYENRGRLNDALLLTISGCWANYWQTSLICHSAAVEAILTYATGPGIARRLAKSYACIAEQKKELRDIVYKEFIEAYSARSDIMHGRTFKIAAEIRLPILARFQELLRKLWRAVLSSEEYMAVLEGGDAQRKSFFQERESGYNPSTKDYDSYSSMDECLDRGGKEPKK